MSILFLSPIKLISYQQNRKTSPLDDNVEAAVRGQVVVTFSQ